LLSGGTSMTMSFLPPPPPLAAGAADELALDVALLAAGALALDVDCELLLEPQPIATRLRAQTIVASRASDRAGVLLFICSPSATCRSRRLKMSCL
jgi:hypothetical protein